jgi:hypothetical protein
MEHSRMAILSMSGLAIVLLAGCGGGWGQSAGGARQMALHPGTLALSSSDVGSPESSPSASRTQDVLRGTQDATCPSENAAVADSETVPIITIKDTVIDQKDTVVARPDSAIQPQGTGYFGWQIGSPNIVAVVVHFKNDDSPLPKGTFVIARHQAVGAGILSDACGYYKYEIRAVTKGGGVLKVDPGTRVY